MSEGRRDLRDVPFRENYSSSGSSLLNEFYIPALSNSLRYDRATGYFSSAILVLAAAAFSEFVNSGGKIRLLTSPHLSAQDAEAVVSLKSSEQPTPIEVAAASLAALARGTPTEAKAVSCLRALIDSGALELRFVTAGQSGLFHDKVGIFVDEDGNRVSFIGSANETGAAWSGFANHEQIEVFRSWTGDSDDQRCTRHEDQFDETWEGLRRGLTVTRSEDAAAIVREIVPSEPLDEIVQALREAVNKEVLQPEVIPLRDYQAEVLESWEAAGHRGIVAFATGGGKTRTALEAIRRWTASGRPALVLVPSELLHHQWESEIEELLPNAQMLLAGAGHAREGWVRRLGDYTRNQPELGQRITLSTFATAATPTFLDLLRHGEHLLVVADEVHGIGAPDTRRILNDVTAGGALGLSATPERFGDPDGTAAISEYFSAKLDPAFTLRDALDSRVLVPYDYEFKTCSLSDDEMERWRALSLRIAQEIARNDGRLSEAALHWLRQRARILKRASAKALIAREVISTHFEPGDRWLVYCSDTEHLGEVRASLEGLGIDLLEYHSQDSGDHDATLGYFTNRGGVLLAIKCLDEGIDIPLINRALILASSTNPREYIQRRGRVLRRTPGKFSSRLFDVIVTDDDGFALTPSEVVRAMEFAGDARNVGAAIYLEGLLPPGFEPGKNSLDIESD